MNHEQLNADHIRDIWITEYLAYYWPIASYHDAFRVLMKLGFACNDMKEVIKCKMIARPECVTTRCFFNSVHTRSSSNLQVTMPREVMKRSCGTVRTAYVLQFVEALAMHFHAASPMMTVELWKIAIINHALLCHARKWLANPFKSRIRGAAIGWVKENQDLSSTWSLLMLNLNQNKS